MRQREENHIWWGGEAAAENDFSHHSGLPWPKLDHIDQLNPLQHHSLSFLLSGAKYFKKRKKEKGKGKERHLSK